MITVEDDDVQEIPNRDPNLTLTIRNGKIQPKKQLSKEVTITSMKSPAAGGSIMLDNDVMVGYDVPFPLGCESPNDVPVHAIRNPNYKGPPQKSKDQMVKKKKDDNNEMARVLKSNPNISMRELFPGEEEMGLNVTMPFNTSAAQRTADGWFKAQMTVQYDEVTKALWESLQRPYGNSSSFLRHLVLLEKYFRNGDLVLSQSASNSAITYSESVRNRLRSYDNIPSSSPISKTSFSNEISIIPTQKAKKPNDSLTITPQPGNSLLKRKASQNDVNSPKQKAMRAEDGTPKKTSPPELISFVQKPAVKKPKEMSESPPAFMSPSISITATNSSSTTTSQTSTSNGNVIVLPQTLTPGDRKLCTKSWRPTLIPITSGTTTPTTGGQLYQTADGRKLPELVQVMSGGKPYHISINDYNRMCIIRREKLMSQKQRLQNQPENGSANINAFTSTNSLSIIPMSKDKDGSFRTPAPSSSPKDARRVLNIPNQFLEQNSLIPLESNGKRHQNGIASLPPPLTSFKGLPSSMNLLSMPPSLLPSALSDLSKTVNSLQPAQQLAAWKALWNDTDLGNNSDNVAALAQIANLASMTQHLTSGMMDTALLSKIPKSLTVIPQAKSNRQASDESRNNSAST